MGWSNTGNIRGPAGATGAAGPAGADGATGATGATGAGISNIVVVNDALQFYAGSNAVGSPVVVPGAVVDGGSPTATSEGSIDGGTL